MPPTSVLPGAGVNAVAHIEALVREIVVAACASDPTAPCERCLRCRSAGADQRARRPPIEACTFIGSSFIRQFVEDWTFDHLLRLTERRSAARSSTVCRSCS